MTESADNSDQTLTQYAAGPSQLEAALAGLTKVNLDLAESADTWTIRQIVHHLVDGDDMWKMCIKAALGNSEGLITFQWYWDRPQTEWAENWNYAIRRIEPSLALFRANRAHVTELVQLTPKAWGRSVRITWPQGDEKRITVGAVLEMQTKHVADHISDIQMIRQTISV